MTLLGSAFLIIWHDIAPEGEADYHAWHTRQHMPERLSHTGFLRSRRGFNRQGLHQRYFTLYEGQALNTFLGPEYAQSLNSPTEWTQRVSPHFRNFLRMSCKTVHSAGCGVGGALSTFRCTLGDGQDSSQTLALLAPALEEMSAHPLVTGVHVGIACPDFADQQTAEARLRPKTQEKPFDVVIITEGVGLLEVERDAQRCAGLIRSAGMRDVQVHCYDNAYTLERE